MGYEHLLILQRTWVWSSAAISKWLTVAYTSSFRTPNTLFRHSQAPGIHVNIRKRMSDKQQTRHGGACLQLPPTLRTWRPRGQEELRGHGDPASNPQQQQIFQNRQIHRSRKQTDNFLRVWQAACIRVWIACFAPTL